LGGRRFPRSDQRPRAEASNVREVLKDLLVPQLETDPCFVAFSGGRDSAALLSLATRLARQHGLPDPVPVTLRFENCPRAEETDWQEITIDHLGLERWEIVPISDELDPLGPVATAILRRHGLFWPSVAHRIAPLLEVARGHVIVFGTGGDETFSPWTPHRALQRLDVRGRPVSKAIKRAAFNLLPARLRVYVKLRRRRHLVWLRPVARREVERRYRAMLRRRGLSWAEAIRGLPESRNFELTQAIFSAMARDADVSLVQPFFDLRFLRAMGESAPRLGFPSRATALQLHFGDVLPPKLLERTTKAVFDELHGGQWTREFAQAWDGSGLDPALIEPEVLRAEWLKPQPEYRSGTALNAAWLATHGAAKS